MSAYWYALRSKPRKEIVVWRHATSLGHEVYYPRIRTRPVNPRAQKVKPFFPGYMFVHEDLEAYGRSHFQWMPFSQGLVSFGGEAARIPPSFISALKKRLKELHTQRMNLLSVIKPGDNVRIRHGPFEGHSAIFDTSISGEERVRVLLTFLSGQQVKLDLDLDSLEKT